MVSMKEVHLSNEGFKNGPVGLQALFVGATAGIGASTVKKFAAYAKEPTVYLVGRSQAKAAPLLAELKSLNPQATFNFIEAEVSLLKDVDKVCDEILAKAQRLDLLWVSQGLLSLAGQQTAGKEAAIVTSDLELSSPENYSLPNATNHTATMTTLALDELSKSNPNVRFIHKYPGIVKTNLLGNVFEGWTGAWKILSILAQTFLIIFSLFEISVEEAGERGLYLVTSEKFNGGGFSRLDWNDEDAKEIPQLGKYREEGMPKKVWEHTVGVFDRVST